MCHSSEHREETFVHVPKLVDQDMGVTIRPNAAHRYSTTFRFANDVLENFHEGHYEER